MIVPRSRLAGASLALRVLILAVLVCLVVPVMASAYELRVSASPDRTPSSLLSGQTLLGHSNYVFVSPGFNVAKVRFYLDNVLQHQERTPQTYWPVDFRGKASDGTNPAPWYTEFEANGSHTLRADIDTTSTPNAASLTATFTVSNGSPGPLQFSPPPCTQICTTRAITDTGSYQYLSLDEGKDYILTLPTSGSLHGGINIDGGRNVRIIGGEIDMTPNCHASGSGSTECQGITVQNKATAGEVYVEGVLVHAAPVSDTGQSGDGIDVYSNQNDLTLQNVRVENIDADCLSSGNHGDVIQPAGFGHARLHIDHFTGTSNCQGIEIEDDIGWDGSGWLPYEVLIANTNLNTIGSTNRHMLWLSWPNCLSDKSGGVCPVPFGSSSDMCGGAPTQLQNVYVSEPGGLPNNSIWPETNYPTGSPCWAAYSNPNYTFGNSPQIAALVKNGSPPSGDFVPASGTGIGYVSPGYR